MISCFFLTAILLELSFWRDRKVRYFKEIFLEDSHVGFCIVVSISRKRSKHFSGNPSEAKCNVSLPFDSRPLECLLSDELKHISLAKFP